MDIEKEFITRIINNPDYTMETAITPDDLQTPAYRAAYKAVNKLLALGVKPDVFSVSGECQQFSSEIADLNTIEKGNFNYFDSKLSDLIQRRRLVVAAKTFGELVADGSDNTEIVSRMEQMISGSIVESDHREIRTLYEIAMEFGPILEKRSELKGALVGVPTGFSRLDDITGGFQPGTYYIGARPSQGKTALLLSMMRGALKAGYSTGLISAESSDIELISRVLSADGPVNATNIRKGSLKPHEYNSLLASLERIKGYNGRIYFNTKTDVETMEAVARRMVKTYGIDVLYIDYLQRINSKGGSKFEQVMNASRAVTDIAKGMGVPVVCLAQTGRQADHEEPSLGHFQYSSAIEQDADVAGVINHYTDGEGQELSNLCILKNRDGEVGNVPVYFDKAHVRFTER